MNEDKLIKLLKYSYLLNCDLVDYLADSSMNIINLNIDASIIEEIEGILAGGNGEKYSDEKQDELIKEINYKKLCEKMPEDGSISHEIHHNNLCVKCKVRTDIKNTYTSITFKCPECKELTRETY